MQQLQSQGLTELEIKAELKKITEEVKQSIIESIESGEFDPETGEFIDDEEHSEEDCEECSSTSCFNRKAPPKGYTLH